MTTLLLGAHLGLEVTRVWCGLSAVTHNTELTSGCFFTACCSVVCCLAANMKGQGFIQAEKTAVEKNNWKYFTGHYCCNQALLPLRFKN